MLRLLLTGCFVLGSLAWLLPARVSLVAQLPVANFKSLKRDVDLFSSGFNHLVEDNRGFIWFGSRNGGGLYRYDGYNLVPFVSDPANMKGSLSTSLIQGIYPVNDTLIYVSTFFGYSSINPISGQIQSFNNSTTAFEDVRTTNTFCFLQDSVHGKLWIGTQTGLACLDHESGKFELKKPSARNPVNLNLVQHIFQDPDQNEKLILAGPDGLFEYDIVKEHFSKINCPLPGYETLTITSAIRDPNKKLWLGLVNGSVVKYDAVNSKWNAYNIPPHPAGEPGNVNDIFFIDDSTVWIASHTRVGMLHTNDGSFEGWSYNEDRPAGLLTPYFADVTSDRHGRLWVASRHGIQMAHQAYLPPSTNVTDLRVAITRVDISPVLNDIKRSLLITDSLNLETAQRDITFHYVLPNPLNPYAVTYQYQLHGYDKDWITSDQRTVRYSKLKGGHYTFMIKAREGEEGEWTNVTELHIHIPKKATEQVWFWLVTGLVFLGLASGLFYFLISRTRKQARMKADFEHKLSEIQMQSLRAQMNPHFLFNSLNSIKYYAITKSKDETAAYLSKFALLVRNILTNSKSRTISLKEELDALRLYIEIEHLRLEGKFDYTIDIDSSIQVRQAQIPPMILQPFVENALWHGLMHKNGKGLLRVQVQDMGRFIQCLIEDNGIGRARSAELKKAQVEHRKSEGMQITADRIELINRLYNIDTKVDVVDLVDDAGDPAGTRVIIHIPYIKDEEE